MEPEQKSSHILTQFFHRLQQIKGLWTLHQSAFSSRAPGLGLKPPATCLPTCQDLSGATMKCLILLLCLAQLCGCRSVPYSGPIPGNREPACDDPETEQAALAAVDYINKHLPHGFKHILNQIDSVKVWPRVSEPAV